MLLRRRNQTDFHFYQTNPFHYENKGGPLGDEPNFEPPLRERLFFGHSIIGRNRPQERELRIFNGMPPKCWCNAILWVSFAAGSSGLAMGCSIDQVEYIRYDLRGRIVCHHITVVISEAVSRRRRRQVPVIR